MSNVTIRRARVVITGAGSGIGEATALRCARAGAEVIAVDIDGTSADRTAEACISAGATHAEARVADVADRGAVEQLARNIEDQRGPVDVLVNNAGVGVGGPFLEASLEDWDWLRGINIDGVAYGCHAFGGPMVSAAAGRSSTSHRARRTSTTATWPRTALRRQRY